VIVQHDVVAKTEVNRSLGFNITPPPYGVISIYAVEHQEAHTTAIALEAIMAVGVRTAR
jgi:hypothetical protein